jgi:hypothetical protein
LTEKKCMLFDRGDTVLTIWPRLLFGLGLRMALTPFIGQIRKMLGHPGVPGVRPCICCYSIMSGKWILRDSVVNHIK